MEFNELAKVWNSVGKNLPANLRQNVAKDLAQLPHGDGVDNFVTYLYKLNRAKKSCEANYGKINEADRKVGRDLQLILIAVTGRIAEVHQLQKGLNTNMDRILQAGQDFMKDESAGNWQTLNGKHQELKKLCVELRNSKYGFEEAAEEIVNVARQILAIRKVSKWELPKTAAEQSVAAAKLKQEMNDWIREMVEVGNRGKNAAWVEKLKKMIAAANTFVQQPTDGNYKKVKEAREEWHKAYKNSGGFGSNAGRQIAADIYAFRRSWPEPPRGKYEVGSLERDRTAQEEPERQNDQVGQHGGRIGRDRET